MTTNTRMHPIDELGLLQSEIATLEVREKELKAKITALGTGAHEGQFYRATVTKSKRFTLPIKIAKAKLKALGATTRWFRAHTEETPVTTVKVVARTGHNLKAAA